MYIISNAWKSISRNKGRNILIGIIILVIATSACVALSIRQAAETAKESTLADMNVTAQISYDRTSAMEEMRNQGQPPKSPEEGEKNGFDRGRFNFEDLQGGELGLKDYMTYTEALGTGDGYYYTMSASLNATGDLLPYGTEESSADSTEETTENTNEDSINNTMSEPGQFGNPADMNSGQMGGRGKMDMVSQGDFSITGYSSYNAMLSLFGEDGTCKISDGSMFDEETSDLTCVISDELAMYNDLSVDDTITLSNPNYEDETYTLTICGIYTNLASSEGNNPFMQTDPANNIYMSYNALNEIVTDSADTGNVVEDESGNERSAAIISRLNFTYTFANADNYYAFEEKVKDLGLGDDYIVSSEDLSSFENSLTPLETLSTIAGWFFLIVLIVGGIILVVLNIFNLRERKYEVGVLTAIGMKKFKVASQFVFELFTITFTAILIGAIIGACVSLPITNTLLENQIQSAQSSSQQMADNFGFDKMPQMGNGDHPGNMGGGRFDNDMGRGGMGGISPDGKNLSYIDSVTSATNITVILQLIGVGILLTIVSSLAAVITIMRYEPLKILSSRS